MVKSLGYLPLSNTVLPYFHEHSPESCSFKLLKNFHTFFSTSSQKKKIIKQILFKSFFLTVKCVRLYFLKLSVQIFFLMTFYEAIYNLADTYLVTITVADSYCKYVIHF